MPVIQGIYRAGVKEGEKLVAYTSACENVIVTREARELGARAAAMTIELAGSMEECNRETIDRLTNEFREEIRSLEDLAGDPRVQAYRRLFWMMKVDPTKTRPSPEALARRLLRTGKIPMISCVVDVANSVSLKTLVSIGLYDLDKLKLPVVIEPAKPGMTFNPIGGGQKTVERGLIVARDAAGRVIHLYAHRDSRDTMITSNTRRILATAYGSPGIGEEYLIDALRLLERSLREAGILGRASEPCMARTV